MKRLWIGFLLIIAVPARADGLPTPEAARQLADKIMEAVSNGDTDRAFSLMKPYARVPSVDIDAANNKIKEQWRAQPFGDSIRYEFLTNEMIGSSVLRITELHRFERHAMQWRFVFYKGAKGWTVNNFNVNDKLQDLFRH